MQPRRPLLKRVAVWTAAVVLLLAGYVAGMPFAELAVLRFVPSLEPAALAFYAPVIYAIKREFPGKDAYLQYYAWCQRPVR